MSENDMSVIIENVFATGASPKTTLDGDQFSVHAIGATSSGNGGATILVEVSNVPNPSADGHWALAGTITLTLTTAVSGDALAVTVPYKHVRVRSSVLTGTGASYSAYLCQG